MQSIIVYAPDGRGKTYNAERIRKRFGLMAVHDNWSPSQSHNTRDTLILTNAEPHNLRTFIPEVCVMSLGNALAACNSQPESVERIIEPEFQTFWMVLADTPTGGCRLIAPPSFRHTSFEKAQREANWLARLNGGKKFYVLETCGAAIVDAAPVWHQSVSELPF